MEWRGADLLRSLGVSGERIHEHPPWVGVVPLCDRDLPAHGWKIHISSRSATFPDALPIVIDVLDREAAAYKIARDSATLADINDGALGSALVGKAVTVYPADVRQFKEIIVALSSGLRGQEGPRIRSDKRFARNAPVYYRYGPFRQEWELDESGSTQLVMTGPEGQKQSGTATTRFEIPGWAADPFASRNKESDGSIFAGRYKVVRGILASPRGDVLVVEASDTGERFILKQARAFVSETDDGIDNRLRLRNERRILQVLDQVPRVPRVHEHLASGSDEYLILSMLPGSDLTCWRSNFDDSFWWGPGGTNEHGEKRLSRRFKELEDVIDKIHSHGIVIRDISPKNILFDGTDLSLVDFGIAEYDGLTLRGGTPGFASRRSGDSKTCMDSLHEGIAADKRALRRSYLFSVLGAMPNPDADEDCWADESYAAQARFAGLKLDDDSFWQQHVPHPSESSLSTEDVESALDAQLQRYVAVVADRLRQPREAYLDQDASTYSGWAGPLLVLADNVDRIAAQNVMEELAERCQKIILGRLGRGPVGIIGDTYVSWLLDQMGLWAGGSVGVPSALGNVEKYQYDLMHGLAGEALVRAAAGLNVDPELETVLRIASGADDNFRRRGIDFKGCDPDLGGAHGASGWLESVLVLLSVATGDNQEMLLQHARFVASNLSDRCASIVEALSSPGAFPMGVSWCQGVAGVARSLAASGIILEDPEYGRVADRALDACRAWVPYLENASLCCGISGIGWAFLQVAQMRNEAHARNGDILYALHLRAAHRGEFDASPMGSLDSWISLGQGAGGVIQTLRSNLGLRTHFLEPDALVQTASAWSN